MIIILANVPGFFLPSECRSAIEAGTKQGLEISLLTMHLGMSLPSAALSLESPFLYIAPSKK